MTNTTEAQTLTVLDLSVLWDALENLQESLDMEISDELDTDEATELTHARVAQMQLERDVAGRLQGLLYNDATVSGERKVTIQ